MNWALGIAVYAIIWWLVLFMVLPWGAGAAIDETDVAKGQSAGAPKRPRMLLKLSTTTIISGGVWGLCYWAVETGMIAFSP